MKKLGLIRLGVTPYGQALALQLRLREELRVDEKAAGQVVVLQHPPTVTLGKRGKLEHLVNPAFLAQQGIEVFTVDRGGEATYHGPGQMVVYPLLRLENLGIGVVDLIRGLAGCLAETLAEYGVEGEYDLEHPGVWTLETPPRKIASVGMRVSRGLTTHGAAINLVNDMQPFSWIIACGMPDAPVVNLQGFTDVDFEEFQDSFLERFGEFLNVKWEPTDVELPLESEWIEPDSVVFR